MILVVDCQGCFVSGLRPASLIFTNLLSYFTAWKNIILR